MVSYIISREQRENQIYIPNFNWTILGSHKQNVKRQNWVSLFLKHVVPLACMVLEHFIWKRLEGESFFVCEKCHIISSNCLLESKIQKLKAFQSLVGSFCQRYLKMREARKQISRDYMLLWKVWTTLLTLPEDGVEHLESNQGVWHRVQTEPKFLGWPDVPHSSVWLFQFLNLEIFFEIEV